MSTPVEFFWWLPSFLQSFWSFLAGCYLIPNVSLLSVLFACGVIIVTVRALMVKG